MRSWTTTVAAAASAVLMAATPVASLADTRIGVWQTTDRQMDYLAVLCGVKADQLCVTLTKVRGSADIPKTRKLVGQMVVDHAAPTGTNTWRGRANYQGHALDGDIVLVPGKTLTVSGCVLLVVCGEFMLIPAR